MRRWQEGHFNSLRAKLRGADPLYLCTIYDDSETAALKRKLAAMSLA